MQTKSRIPSNWQWRAIEALAASQPNAIVDGPFGSNLKISDYVDRGVPVLQGSNITGNSFSLNDVRFVTEQKAHELRRSLVRVGDLLVVKIGSIGYAAIIDDLGNYEVALIPANLLKATFDSNKANSRFILHYLTSNFGFQLLNDLAGRTAQPALSLGKFKNLLIPTPPLPEQRRIAAILDTLDATIAQTEALIAKLKQARAGLLHDLLTCGLDERGELRDPIAHPEQFKETDIGKVPREWEVHKLSEVVPRAEYGISVSLEDEIGIPVLRMNNLKDGEAELSDVKRSASVEAANLLLRPMDVLFNRTNSIDHVGRTGIWRGQIAPASFASYLVRLIPDLARLLPEYLNLWLNLSTTQLTIRRFATPGVHQVNINPTNLRKVLIALPESTQEQKMIVDVVIAHDSRIRTEESYRNKLKLQKQGLMHDLLTGRVQVGTM